MNKTVSINSMFSDKDCLLKVHVTDDDSLHQSWEINGKIIVYENIPKNYPAGSLIVYSSFEEYFDSIKEVSWINNVRESGESILYNHINESFPEVVPAYKKFLWIM